MDSTGLTTLMDAHVGRERNGWSLACAARHRRSDACSTSPVCGPSWTRALDPVESQTVPRADGQHRRARDVRRVAGRVEADPATDDFYSRLCEATCKLADMDRAVIFRYDGAAAGPRGGRYGIDPDCSPTPR